MPVETVDRRAALGYAAPFVIERLMKDGIAGSEHEADLLFREAKRYLVLAHEDRTRGWPMFSTHVDDAWHAFILYTAQYTEFCQRFFGRYVHHAPNNAPACAPATERPAATFAQFRSFYEELYAGPLPDVWFDARTLVPARRLVNDEAGRQRVVRSGGEAHLVGSDGEILLSVNEPGEDALEFIARTGAFYLRELPGNLTDEDRVDLAQALVEDRVLKASG